MEHLPEISTPAQLAEYLGVPLATIYRWNYLGTGPKRLRLGRHVRFRKNDVERWLSNQTVTS